jgi:hydroxypyruvate isomerase
MTGYLSGNFTDDREIASLLASAEVSLGVAEQLGCPSLNLHGTGLDEKGLPVKPVEVVTGAMWLKAASTLEKLATMAERAGKVFTLENLNTAVDHPGTPFAKASEVLALVEAVNSPHLRINLDLYHAQIGEGNLIELVKRAGSAIGEIQVADVPGRQEPGTGEINYRAIANALRAMNYQGVVAMEGWASGDSETALMRFKEQFML